MGEAKRRKLLDHTFGENKKIEYRDADGFVTQQVVEFARKQLFESGRGIVILGDRLGYMPLAKCRNQPDVYKLVSTYDTTNFILAVTPPKSKICMELIRGEMERLGGKVATCNEVPRNDLKLL